MNDNAAGSLLGMTLNSGWKVIEKIEKGDNGTGSFFSVCYKVEKDGEICFLKAFDFAKFFQMSQPGTKVVDIIGDMITAYQYERDLSNHCKNKRVTKVSFVIEADEEIVNGYAVSIVPYLIFDLADGDVRKKLDFDKKLDYAWRLKSLHDIAIGLRQLHQVEVTHQDLKPSNVLVYNSDCKIGDLGRSICQSIDGPYNKMSYTGDISYAPPEILYGYYERDWKKRVFATDCYMLGSMIVFYFAGVNMTVLLKENLAEPFWYENWKGTFDELKDYLLDAFEKSISNLENAIKDNLIKEDLAKLVRYLCHPFPDSRGHPKTINSIESNYNLERFITVFDRLQRKAEILVKQS